MTAKPILNGLLLGGALLGVAALLKTGEHMNLITQETAVRASQRAIGLVLAFYANYIPKKISEGRIHGRMQTALRISGWCFMLAGLAYALLSAFAPLGIGGTVSMAAVASAVVVTLGLTFWACAKPGAAQKTE